MSLSLMPPNALVGLITFGKMVRTSAIYMYIVIMCRLGNTVTSTHNYMIDLLSLAITQKLCLGNGCVLFVFLSLLLLSIIFVDLLETEVHLNGFKCHVCGLWVVDVNPFCFCFFFKIHCFLTVQWIKVFIMIDYGKMQSLVGFWTS